MWLISLPVTIQIKLSSNTSVLFHFFDFFVHVDLFNGKHGTLPQSGETSLVNLTRDYRSLCFPLYYIKS